MILQSADTLYNNPKRGFVLGIRGKGFIWQKYKGYKGFPQNNRRWRQIAVFKQWVVGVLLLTSGEASNQQHTILLSPGIGCERHFEFPPNFF